MSPSPPIEKEKNKMETLDTIPQLITNKLDYSVNDLRDGMRNYNIPGVSQTKKQMEDSCEKYIKNIVKERLGKECYERADLEFTIFLILREVEINRKKTIARIIDAREAGINYSVEDLKSYMRINNITGLSKKRAEMEDLILEHALNNSGGAGRVGENEMKAGEINKEATKELKELKETEGEEKKRKEKKGKENKRKGFTGQQRTMVWDKYIGEDKRRGPCFCCEAEMKFTRFEVGHVMAVAEGGDNNIDNLRPVCFDCNRAMGTKNMFEYKIEINRFTNNTHEDARPSAGRHGLARILSFIIPCI